MCTFTEAQGDSKLIQAESNTKPQHKKNLILPHKLTKVNQPAA